MDRLTAPADRPGAAPTEQRWRPTINLGFTVKSKGVRGVYRRAKLIAGRFGVTSARMEQYLRQCLDIAREFDTTWTLPITAMPISRSPDLIRRYSEEGLNFAVHGLVHNDHAVASFSDQVESIKRAQAIFAENRIPLAGFRGPYLRHNTETIEALRTLGFEFTSTQAVTFSNVRKSDFNERQRDAYDRAIELYSALDARDIAVRPRDAGNLIDIPIAIPDDEIMVDRFNFSPAEQSATWTSILDETYRRGDLFTVQLHPERIFECLPALRAVLTAARDCHPAIWIASLEEITDWWNERCQSHLTVTECGESSFRVCLTGSPDATILSRGMNEADTEPWYGSEELVRSREFEVSTPVKPVVGLSTRAPASLSLFLHEEGFPYEVSDDRSKFGAYVDCENGTFRETDVLESIDRQAGPLIRMSRWPRGARSALALTGDIDSITLQDFAIRLWETR